MYVKRFVFWSMVPGGKREATLCKKVYEFHGNLTGDAER